MMSTYRISAVISAVQTVSLKKKSDYPLCHAGLDPASRWLFTMDSGSVIPDVIRDRNYKNRKCVTLLIMTPSLKAGIPELFSLYDNKNQFKK
jgi:hypothetical protein